MKYAQIFAIGTILAMLSLLFGGGCSTIGNGRLDIDAGAVIGAAAAGATGDYAKALAAISKAVKKRQADGDPLAGFTFTRTYFYNGAPVSDPSRITWKDEWARTGTAGGQSVPAVVETGTASASSPPDEALVNEIAEALIRAGLAEE